MMIERLGKSGTTEAGNLVPRSPGCVLCLCVCMHMPELPETVTRTDVGTDSDHQEKQGPRVE